MYQTGRYRPLLGRLPPKEDEILLVSMDETVANNAAAAQTIRDALIDAGVDLERARAGSSVYYPDLLPQVSRVATQPEVIDAVRSIRSDVLTPGARAGHRVEIDPCDVFGIILSITFVAASSASIL